MSNPEINRSVRFVSLDTHPANNALVITYEILVTIFDSDTRNELSRRSKRDQMQIHISALDNLNEEELRADKLMVNLQEMSAKILRQCPLLANCDHQSVEDIQLHLLYLIGRRRSQLLATQESNDVIRDRPPSSASISRLRGLNQNPGSKLRLGSANQRQPRARLRGNSGDLYDDIYSYFHTREQGDVGAAQQAAYEDYMRQFDDYLSEIEESNRSVPTDFEDYDIDAQLEGLYGDLNEKRSSMALLRRLSRQDEGLLRMSSNRLLVCAMLRTMRDASENTDFNLRESILYCLIRFTEFADVCSLTFDAVDKQQDSIDLMQMVVHMLAEQVQSLLSAGGGQHQMMIGRHFYLSSLLITITNLLKLENGHKQLKHLLVHSATESNQHQSWAASLVDLLRMSSQQLARDIRLLSEPVKSLSLLRLLIDLLLQLSIFKEFLVRLRSHSTQLADSLLNLLTTLQLSRPGNSSQAAGNNRKVDLPIVTKQQTLNEIYALEIDLMRLINNIILDYRLRSKLIKKNLLKCVLRNLVVFLASNKEVSSTLAPFHRSNVLMVPLKCLYELACYDQIKLELYKSKIIMKCLLEYLLSATTDLKHALDSRQQVSNKIGGHSQRLNQKPSENPDEMMQIVVEPAQASHYILSLWVNLSCRPEAPIHKLQTLDELGSSVGEYIELANNILRSFFLLPGSNNSQQAPTQTSDQLDLMIYLHAKLLRNLSQYVELDATECHEETTLNSGYTKWLQSFAELCNNLLANKTTYDSVFQLPLAVECLATLNNLVEKGECFDMELLLSAIPMGPLIEQLLSLNRGGECEADNDDLLIVSIIFLGTLARNKEICGEISSLAVELIQASNYILETRCTDQEMIISCLFTMSQLMNHSDFLSQVSSHIEQQAVGGESSALEQLLEQLAELELHANAKVARLAVVVLNRLRRLEEQRSIESQVHKKQFAGFNSKWLQTIRASRDQLTGDGQWQLPTGKDADHEEELRALGQEQSGGSSSAGSSNGEPRERRLVDDYDDDDDCGDGKEEVASSCFGDDAPDLNVIDANSMIKHLTSRREFRSEWFDR